MEEERNEREKPPSDRYHVVYLILLLHGVGILLPWNMFITARSYFVDYKLSKNYTGVDSNYATYFVSSVGFASQIPNVIFSWTNVFINIRGSTTPRVLLTIIVEIIMFVITIILAAVDTNNCPSVFFWSVMIIIVLLNTVNGIYQNTMFGVAAKLPVEYPGAIVLGSNISGTFVSIVELMTYVTAPSIKTAAIYYFITALLILVVCLVTYFVMIRNKFYRYHDLFVENLIETIGNSESTKRIPYWQLFKKASSQLFNVFFIFFVTLSIFPAIQASIKQSDPHFIIPDKYYISVMCFITFNTAAMLGCVFSNFINWPSPKALLIPVLLRGLFIPFFFFCNYQPPNKVRKVPVLILNDWGYWIAGILLGFTSGYLSTKAMIYTSRSVQAGYEPISGMFGSAILVTGIFFGVLLSMIFPLLVEL